MSKRLKIIALLLLALVSVFFCFTRLDDRFLWEDEAETAVIARNMQSHCLPIANDGKNQVTQESGFDANAAKIWTLQSWLPHYMTAAAFKLFGVSTFSARLPFAVCGLLTIGFVFFITYRDTRSFFAAYMAAILLLTNVLFLLHVRQCRYYAASVFLAMLWWRLYWRYIQCGRGYSATIIVGALLFHAQYYVGATLWIACFLAADIVRSWRRALAVLVGLLPLVLPWVIYVRLWQKQAVTTLSLFDRAAQGIVNIFFQIININHFMIGMVLVIAWIFFARGRSRYQDYIMLSAGFYVLCAVVSPLYPDIRYILILVYPAILMLVGIVLLIPYRGLQSVFMASLIFSNIWSMPYWLLVRPIMAKNVMYYRDLRFDLLGFLYELGHDNTGPTEAFVGYSQGHPGRTVFTSYEAESLLFYTQLQVIRTVPFNSPPDWIILRGDPEYTYRWMKWVIYNPAIPHRWNFNHDADTSADWAWREKYIQGYLKRYHYREIVLPIENTVWEQRPNLLFHRFGYEPVQQPLHVYALPW